MKRGLRTDDSGVSVVVGAIIVLAILTVTLLYFNAYRVPQEGASRDAAFVTEAEQAMQGLHGSLRPGGSALQQPTIHATIPLLAPKPQPGLFAGLLLTPATGSAAARFDPEGPRITVAYETTSGVTVHALGNATQGAPLGNLSLNVTPAYLSRTAFVLEGGALLRGDGGGDDPHWVALQAPGITLNATHATLRLVKLTGAETDVDGARVARATLTHEITTPPSGEVQARRVTLQVESGQASAWSGLLAKGLGALPACPVSPPTTSCLTEAPGTVRLILVGPSGGTAADLRLTAELTAYRVDLN